MHGLSVFLYIDFFMEKRVAFKSFLCLYFLSWLSDSFDLPRVGDDKNLRISVIWALKFLEFRKPWKTKAFVNMSRGKSFGRRSSWEEATE